MLQAAPAAAAWQRLPKGTNTGDDCQNTEASSLRKND